MGTVDDYLSELAEVDREVVARVYALAREVVPDAEQGLGYGMPCLLHHGKPLLAVMRAKGHVGVYPFSPEAVESVADDLASHPGIGLAKGTIRFQPASPLPEEIVKALVRARAEQIAR
ncbi:DUF1801 domain-containing protein [Tessaracoccus sp. OS52]|uniref:iron chaperone n=1 Tax=Tessaracoccus sp. OS52 TaxID=2886691 RepID=UPI001D112022|nr:DUF1801 domain-containing protein [Tessaracoccus sp. OS52]MCC2593014.1 DUF1801 domain-containing protein [Tessaracoccus sp. OS52]